MDEHDILSIYSIAYRLISVATMATQSDMNDEYLFRELTVLAPPPYRGSKILEPPSTFPLVKRLTGRAVPIRDASEAVGPNLLR
jgi:hypothetical protein